MPPGRGEGTGDPSLLVPLLDQHTKNTGWTPQEVLADGAYDSGELYREVSNRGGKLVCPPPSNGTLRLRKAPGRRGKITPEDGYGTRNDRLHRRAQDGDDSGWKVDEGYHRRSLAETTNHRFIASFGDRLRTRLQSAQEVEVRVKMALLNMWRATEVELAGGYISFEGR